MKYKLTNSNSVVRLSDNACIPFAEGNRDYREYLNWLEEGNEPEPADPIPEPDPIVMRRAAYREESDPLFIEASFDMDDEKFEVWRQKVREIKERYPLTKES